MPPARRPSLRCEPQLDLLVIEAETNRIRSLGLNTLAQGVPRNFNLSRSRLTARR
jgi:hypothetical protein